MSEFKQLWLEQCPQIILMKPATDPCSTCQGFTVSLSKFARGGKGAHVTKIWGPSSKGKEAERLLQGSVSRKQRKFYKLITESKNER